MAASFHHICEYESRILAYFWKEKHRLTWIRIKNQVNAPNYRLEIQTPNNVHPSFLIPSWCLILLLKNLLASHFLVRILEKWLSWSNLLKLVIGRFLAMWPCTFTCLPKFIQIRKYHSITNIPIQLSCLKLNKLVHNTTKNPIQLSCPHSK